MKYVHHFFIVFQLLYGVTLGALAQAPQVIHYQAVIHDGADVLSNTEIGVRTSILQWEAEFPGSPYPPFSRDIAINSFLKLPLAGYRKNDGDLEVTGLGAYRASRTESGLLAIEFYNGGGGFDSNKIVRGYSVRCIKD